MDLFKQILDYVFIIGAGQGVLLSVFLLRKKENRTANRILGCTIIAFVLELIMAVYINSEAYLRFPHFVGLTAGFPYLYGPGIYLYVNVLGHNREGFKKNYWLHYIPFALVFIATLFIFLPSSAAFKISLFQAGAQPPLYITIVSELIPVHGCLYALFTIIKAREFNKLLKNSYSNLDKINLSWLTFLSIGTAVIWTIVVIAYILDFISNDRIPSYLLIYSSISVLVYTMGYKSLRQPDVQVESENETPGNSTPEKSEPYKKSGLQEEIAKEYLTRLQMIMDDQKPFLDSGIRLSDLAALLTISTHNLSEVINSQLGENFYDFINKYRVEEVKRLISSEEGQKYNLLSIGYEAGFSSKSAYYTAFKKVTGLTPAKYRDSISESSKHDH